MKKKFTSIYNIKHLVFEVQPSRSPKLNPVDFYIRGGIKTLLYWAALERGGHQHIFDTF